MEMLEQSITATKKMSSSMKLYSYRVIFRFESTLTECDNHRNREQYPYKGQCNHIKITINTKQGGLF